MSQRLYIFYLATASFAVMWAKFQREDGACEMVEHVSPLLSETCFFLEKCHLKKGGLLSELCEPVAHSHVG